LSDVLANGPLPSKDVENEGREAGIEPRTLKRAKQRLGVVSERQGGIGEKGRWYWRLPNGTFLTKGTHPGEGPLSGGTDRTDAKNPAYSSRDPQTPLRGPSAENTKGAGGRGPLSEPLSAEGPDELGKLLDNPPSWLSNQLAMCEEDPVRFLNPTATAIADHLYGSAGRWREITPVLATRFGGTS